VKRNVLNCLLKEAREVAVVTLVGRLFHARAAVTRKDRSPMVRSRVLGTIRRCWEPDRSHCSDSASSVHWRTVNISILPFISLEPNPNPNLWRMANAMPTYGYLPSRRASPPIDRYQVILHGDSWEVSTRRGQLSWSRYVSAGVEPTTSSSQVRRIICCSTTPPQLQ